MPKYFSHSFNPNTETFEFHTILGYHDGKSLFNLWKEKEMKRITH